MIITDLKGITVLKTFKAFIKKYAKPVKLLTDQGRSYISKELKQYCDNEKIKHVFSSIYNPTFNGIAERTNKIIKELLRTYKGNNLKKVIKIANLRLNIFKRRNTKHSPFELIHGHCW